MQKCPDALGNRKIPHAEERPRGVNSRMRSEKNWLASTRHRWPHLSPVKTCLLLRGPTSSSAWYPRLMGAFPLWLFPLCLPSR